jgi:hypothetical protein
MGNKQAVINTGVGVAASSCCSGYVRSEDYVAVDKATGKVVILDQDLDPTELFDNENLVITKVKKCPVNYNDLHAEYIDREAKWTDPDFPPDDSSIGAAELAYKPRWARIPDVIPRAEFKVNKIEPDDILQGGLGDCYLLSAIAALAEKENRLNGLFPDLRSHHETGVYSVLMIHAGMLKEVVVDDWIPLDPAGRPAFVQPRGN